jgi:hypothetical protein
VVVEGHGTPLALPLTGAHGHDSLPARPTLEAIPVLPRPRGRPRRNPRRLYGDRAYGSPRNRQGLQERRSEDHLAAPGMPPGSGVGKVRWVVERSLSWIGQARRLKVRYDRLAAMPRGVHYLQLARICCKVLQRDF